MRRAIQITGVVLALLVGAYLSFIALRQEKGPSGSSTPSTVSELPPLLRSEVTITCSPAIVGVRGDLFGTSLNLPHWADTNHHSVDWNSAFVARTEAALADHIKTTGPKVNLRFGYQPFDGYLDEQGKAQGGYRWREALDGRNGQMGLDDYIALVRRVRGEPQIVVNLATGTASEAADLVAYANGTDPADPMVALRRERGHPEPYGVKYFEIGADTWSRQSAGYERFAGSSTGARDALALAQRINDFASAMRPRSASQVRLYAPITDIDLTTWPDATLKKIISTVAPSVDGYALSFFASRATGDHVDAPNVAPSGWQLGQMIAELRTKIRDASRGRESEIVVSQWGGSSNPTGMGRTWLTGLVLVDSITVMAEQGVAFSSYFAAAAPPGPAAEYSFWLDNDPTRPAPALIASELTSRHFGRELLETRSVGIENATATSAKGQYEFPSIGARCSRRDYDAFLIVVNRTPKPRRTNIALDFTVAAAIDSTQLVAPTSSQSVDAARVTYQPASKFSIELPPYSATYLRLPLA